MKKILIIAGLLAVSYSCGSAASTKTSRPVVLDDIQMEAVKAQGTILVYQWVNSSYNLVYQHYLGPTPYQLQVQYSGGPLNGVEYLGQEPPNATVQDDTWLAGGFVSGYIIVPPYHN